MNRLLSLAKICFCMMIFTLPITMLPARYTIPILGGNLPEIFLLFSIIFCVIYVVIDHDISFPRNGMIYFLCFFTWSLFCLIWGWLNFPYYDAAVDASLRNSRMVSVLSNVFPTAQDNTAFLHIKMLFSYFWYMIRGFFFTFLGTWFILYTFLYKRKFKELQKGGYNAIYGLSIVMVLYSIPEIIWLWTGNITCANLLSFINVHLYDPVVNNGWWPPLLWNGQLRSVCLEPSYFGIITTFLLPFLAIDIHKKFKLWKFLIFFMLVFMIFMTKARTATVVFLGESLIFFIFSIVYRYTNWKRTICTLCAVIIGTFCLYVGTSTLSYQDTSASDLTGKYINENIVSVVGKDKRSNSARFGNTVALINIGMDYPITGVGMGFHSPYMTNRFPDFAQDNSEVKNWLKDMREKTFLESGLPVLNEYAALFAWEGILGVVLFLLPPLYLIKKYLVWQHDHCYMTFKMICLIVALIGQMVCMLSAGMFLTYPLTLWILYSTFEFEKWERIID